MCKTKVRENETQMKRVSTNLQEHDKLVVGADEHLAHMLSRKLGHVVPVEGQKEKKRKEQNA